MKYISGEGVSRYTSLVWLGGGKNGVEQAGVYSVYTIKSAQEQPGIADLMSDLMFVYGQYAEMLQKSREYLEGIKPKVIISASSDSA